MNKNKKQTIKTLNNKTIINKQNLNIQKDSETKFTILTRSKIYLKLPV